MVRELTPELAKIAREELNENPKTIANDLQHLKEWISKQPHLKARTDDQWLIALLRGCKYSLERVKKKLDLYYTLRTTAPEITMRIKPTDPKFIEFFRQGPSTQAATNLPFCKEIDHLASNLSLLVPKSHVDDACRTVLILPKPKNELTPRVLLIRAGAYNPAVHNVADVICMLYYLVQILVVYDDVASILGTKIVVDYEGVSMSHFSQAPPLLKKIIAVAQDSMPLRLKGSHHMNLAAGIEKIFTLVSVFLNEKAKQRLKIHKSHEELLEYIPKEIIPQEYGGSGPTIAKITEYWVQKLKEYEPWMKQEEQFGTDESKRVGPPVDADLMAEGSFRKLDID